MPISRISRRDMLRAALTSGAGLNLLSAELATPADGQAAGTGGDMVLFDFYSSCEREMTLAYTYSLRGQWQWRFVKMQKSGNRFHVKHPVPEEVWYEFVSPNVWFKRDPLNQHVDSDHPYLKRGSAPLITNRNLKVTYVPSEHFDYFTKGDGAKIDEMEVIYAKLTNDVLTMFGPNLTPVHGKKIRYYGGIFDGIAYARPWNGEIVENGDFPNSHEMIHVLLHEHPCYSPFTEGIAQCLQQCGNQRPLTELNCSLAARERSKDLKLWDVLSDFEHHRDYFMAGSFIFHHLFIIPRARKRFVAFLKELKDWKIGFAEVTVLYEKHMGKNLKTAIADWENWVSGVNKSSDVYVDWDMSNDAAAMKLSRRFVGDWTVGRPNGSELVISLASDLSAKKGVGDKMNGRWLYLDGKALIKWKSDDWNIIQREGSTYRMLFYKAGMPLGDPSAESSAAERISMGQ